METSTRDLLSNNPLFHYLLYAARQVAGIAEYSNSSPIHLLIFAGMDNLMKKPFPNMVRRRPEGDPNKTLRKY